MKIFGIIAGILILLVVGAGCLFFSDFGNNLTKPYIENLIKEKSGLDVKLEKFDLNFGDLDISANVNDAANVNVKGKYSLFARSFDLNYDANAHDLAKLGIKTSEGLSLKGQILGDLDKFGINGSGRIFDSNVKFLANLKDLKPLDLQIDAKGLNVEKALAVASLPIYAKGNIDILSDIKASSGGAEGNASIKSSNLILNESAFKDMNISIPKGVQIMLNSDITAQNDVLRAASKIDSTLGKIGAEKSEFDLKNKTLNSDFNLSLPDLAKLESLIGRKISGDVKANGNLKTDFSTLELSNSQILAFKDALKADAEVKYDLKNKNGELSAKLNANDLAALQNVLGVKLQGKANGELSAALAQNELKNLSLNLNAMGGNLNANGNLSDLKLKTSNLNLAVLSALFYGSAIGEGTINGDAKLSLKDGINGTAQISLASGVIFKKFLDGATGKNFPSDLKTDAQAQTNIKNSVATFSVSANSDLAQLQSLNGTYELKNKALKANYALLIPSLQRLEFFLNRRLNGKIAATGELSHDGKSLFATINSKVAGGELNGQIAGDEANFKIQNFIVKELTTLLNIDHVYDGTGNANLTYNTSSHSGKFDAIINNGRLPSGGLIDKIGKILGRDLGGEVYNDAKVNGTIKQNLINFNADMSAQKSKLNVTGGTLDSKTGAISVPVKANIEKTDLEINITGTIKEPKYNVQSDYLKGKLDKQIGKGIDKLFGVKKDDNSSKNDAKKEQSDAIKGLINGLF
ncbi:hypothetical protein [uncultured Campylobacter sp.]|uniref:hypothetical protein n=1 Tax=uncultured Campylobacter sp. TaxID=218934 RepID=UPI002609BBE2|nr:hypothetical protein [uncultured Campylobacter sp.]